MFKVGLVVEGAARVDFSAGHVVPGPVSGLQWEILRSLHQAREAGAPPPSLSTLATIIKRSKSTTHYHMQQLERKGLLIRRPGSQAIELTPITQNPSLGVGKN